MRTPRNARARHLDAAAGGEGFLAVAALFLRECSAAQIQLAPAQCELSGAQASKGTVCKRLGRTAMGRLGQTSRVA